MQKEQYPVGKTQEIWKVKDFHGVYHCKHSVEPKFVEPKGVVTRNAQCLPTQKLHYIFANQKRLSLSKKKRKKKSALNFPNSSKYLRISDYEENFQY